MYYWKGTLEEGEMAEGKIHQDIQAAYKLHILGNLTDKSINLIMFQQIKKNSSLKT